VSVRRYTVANILKQWGETKGTIRMLCRVATVGGAVGGWGTALAMVALSLTNHMDDMTAQTIMLVALSVGLLASACLALRSHQRPLGAAFELGYDMGRRDAIREGTRRTNVAPIRRKGGLSEFSSDVVG
jgi:hypothetical protein